jgi:hypothetical protein
VRLIIMIMLGSLLCSQAQAQRPEKVRVLWNNPSQDLACGLTAPGIQAAVESSLRRNGFQISHQTDLRAMKVEIAILSAALSSSVSSCAASVSLSFSFPIRTTAIWGGTYSFRTVDICSQTALLTGPSTDMQRRIRDKMSEFVDVCTGEEERSRDR